MQFDSSALNRHARIACGVSGGKDSTACVWLLREQWHRVRFYHLSTGDLLPEVVAVVDELKAMLPNLTVIDSDVAGWVARHGEPSDLVPHSAHPTGQEMAEGRRISSRYDCCGGNLMTPLFDRIKADGNTLLIRGTKACDMVRLPMRSGETLDGVELLLPLLTWSHADVMDYLFREGAPISAAYAHFTNLPECATCPAWWTERRASYLRTRHPALYRRYQERMVTVLAEVGPVVASLAEEMKELGYGG